MHQRRVFVDLDEVVADLLTDFALLCNERLGTNITRESFIDWNWSDLLGFPPEVFQNLLSTPGLFTKLKPIPEAVPSIRKLMKDDRFDILFLSASTSRTSCSEKRNWVRQHFGQKGAENLILTTRKDVIGTKEDWLIDDRPKNIQEWKGTALLFDAPHNKNFQHSLRVNNWEEALFLVEDGLQPKYEDKHGWDGNGSPAGESP